MNCVWKTDACRRNAAAQSAARFLPEAGKNFPIIIDICTSVPYTETEHPGKLHAFARNIHGYSGLPGTEW